MNTESKAKQLMGYAFLVVFAKDAGITEGELHMLEKLALEDGQVDAREREVLRNIFRRIDTKQVAETVLEEMDSFKAKHDI